MPFSRTRDPGRLMLEIALVRQLVVGRPVTAAVPLACSVAEVVPRRLPRPKNMRGGAVVE